MSVRPEQIAAARILLRFGQSELARRAKVSIVTIRRLESSARVDQVAPETRIAVQRTLEDAGAEFIDGGVRRRAESDPPALLARLRAISARSAQRHNGATSMTDADLYDESGLPV